MSASLRTGACSVFTKTDCPLCDELKDRLRHLGVAYMECDITTRSDWYERYKNRVPVLRTAAGREYDPPFDDECLGRLEGVCR